MPPVRGRGGGRRGRPRKSRVSEAEPAAIVEEVPQPPFFSTTFSVHRVSPLYLGEQSDHGAMLRTLSNRLRDTLIGDVVRGVYVGLDPTQSEIGNAGSLESVKLHWVRVSDVISQIDPDRRPPSRDLSSDAPDNDGIGLLGMRRGIWIDIRYENAACTGMLLPDLSSEEEKDIPEQTWVETKGKKRGRASEVDPSHFLQLPLLLLRMPTPLKKIVTEWLSGVFDCHISPLSLGTRSLVRIWETWLKTATVPETGPKAKEVVVTLGFSLPHLADEIPDGVQEDDEDEEGLPRGLQQGLRSIDISIQPDDISQFVLAGEAIAENRDAAGPKPWMGDARTRKILAGGHEDDGWAWKAEDSGTGDSADDEQPFIDALAFYLDEHLALNLFHPSVRVTRISSPGFVLTDSRIKVFETTDAKAVCNLLADVTRRSLGTELPQVF
ncbi:hypothetical protein jhhlp_007793 [Lomentospora prolificans]|uniref:Uncharacterized protein n=1 Tax=Lomentospora prolificans TaxID=41688 RepID=A0A2N3N0K5_9PEZI|nr:hypothetical protein jhhlp_007793 [Lomentospora prolificans]